MITRLAQAKQQWQQLKADQGLRAALRLAAVEQVLNTQFSEAGRLRVRALLDLP